MSYSIRSIPQFDKQIKRIVKKYPSFKDDFGFVVQSLRHTPIQGTPIGKNCYKIRIAITTKSKGKSGGAGIITNFVVSDHTIYLLAIYDKSEKQTVTDSELNELLRNVPV